MSNNEVIALVFALVFFLNITAYVTMSVFGLIVSLITLPVVFDLLDKLQ